MSNRRELITDGGILVVGLASAVLTFTTLSALGLAVGFTGALFGFQLAWLLPVVVDVAAIVAARVWLQGQADAGTVQYARRLAMACILLSVVFNGGWHLLAAAGLTTAPWWVVLPVTSVPPAVLAAVVHLGHLLHRTAVPDHLPVRSDHPVQTTPDHPVRVDIEVVREPVRPADHPAIEAGSDHPTTPAQTAGPATDHSGRAQVVQDAEPAPDQARTTPDHPDRQDPDHLLDRVVRWAATLDGPPSQRAVRREFNVGRDRAVQLLDHLAQTTQTTPSEE